VFAVKGAGADIWGTADGFHFVYQPVSGDGDIRARVTSLDNVNAYAKAGVMIRETLGGDAKHVLIDAKPNGELEVLSRAATGGTTSYLGGATPGFPAWIRLQRRGNTISAAWSRDGVAWTTVASTSVSMASGVCFGMGVTSHATSVLATGRFDNVAVETSANPLPNAPPTVSLTAPTAGQAFTAPATIALAAAASDSDGTVARVEFYSGTSLLGTDTAAPYQASWSNVAAGSYTLTAVAIDNAGASVTSAPVSITVSTAPAQPTLAISASPTKRTVSRGSTASGLASPVTFAVTGLPASTTASFSPTSLNGSGTTTLSVVVGSSAPRGSRQTLTVTATSGTVSATTSVILEIRR
jgi:regulation of enolase protein 1 (concanavalin A-like superfamily)